MEEIEEIMAYEYHEDIKVKHRKSRKAKRRKANPGNYKSHYIGKTASAYGKQMLHRYNRRVRNLNLTSSDYYKHIDYSFSSILWAMS